MAGVSSNASAGQFDAPILSPPPPAKRPTRTEPGEIQVLDVANIIASAQEALSRQMDTLGNTLAAAIANQAAICDKRFQDQQSQIDEVRHGQDVQARDMAILRREFADMGQRLEERVAELATAARASTEAISRASSAAEFRRAPEPRPQADDTSYVVQKNILRVNTYQRGRVDRAAMEPAIAYVVAQACPGRTQFEISGPDIGTHFSIRFPDTSEGRNLPTMVMDWVFRPTTTSS